MNTNPRNVIVYVGISNAAWYQPKARKTKTKVTVPSVRVVLVSSLLGQQSSPATPNSSHPKAQSSSHQQLSSDKRFLALDESMLEAIYRGAIVTAERNSANVIVMYIPLNLLCAFTISSMSTQQAIVDKALHHFNVEGWNCAESVYMAIFQEYYKLPATPKTATAFGGGIARTGSICGAVNIAILGISQKYGRTNPRTPFIRTQRPVFQFLNTILDEYGTIQCSRLKKTQHAKQQAKEQSLQEHPCSPLIKTVMETFLAIAENNTQP